MGSVEDRGDSVEKLSLAAAMAQSYARDQVGFVGMVGAMLEDSLGGQVVVVRKPVKLFSSEKKTVQVTITLPPNVYDIQDVGHGRLCATIYKIVGGITLSSKEVGIDKWLIDLEAAVNHYAEDNQSTSEAIKGFLNQHGL